MRAGLVHQVAPGRAQPVEQRRAVLRRRPDGGVRGAGGRAGARPAGETSLAEEGVEQRRLAAAGGAGQRDDGGVAERGARAGLGQQRAGRRRRRRRAGGRRPASTASRSPCSRSSSGTRACAASPAAPAATTARLARATRSAGAPCPAPGRAEPSSSSNRACSTCSSRSVRCGEVLAGRGRPGCAPPGRRTPPPARAGPRRWCRRRPRPPRRSARRSARTRRP